MENSSEWIHEEWKQIDARVAKAEYDLNQADALAKKLLVDMEFLRIMFEEDLL